MERKEILEKLKTTEAEISQKIGQAEHKRNEVLMRAQKQARKLEEENELKMKAERDGMFTAARKTIEEERRRVLKKATAEADLLKKKAQVKKAQDFFIRKFEEFVHV
jgi:vacuolar-type H+-ATPase subunit H